MSGSVDTEKKKVAVKEPKMKAPKAVKNDILGLVRQATLTDTEVQALIDVLLLKQVRIESDFRVPTICRQN